MGRWLSYPRDHRRSIKSAPGCYAIFDELGLLYIGQSENVWSRLNHGHNVFAQEDSDLRSRKFDVRISHIKVRYDKLFGERLMREARLIRKLRPSGNANLGIRKRKNTLVSHRGMKPHEIESW